MGKHSRHYTDLNPLEGGGSGGGGKSAGRPLDAEFYMPAGGAALVTAGMAALGAKNDAKREREAKSEMKRESRGKEDSMTPGQKQSMQEAKDAEMQPKIRKAYEDSKNYKGGGMTASSRADGCCVKGKTRGMMR